MRATALARRLTNYRSGNSSDTDESRTDSTEYGQEVQQCPPGCKPAKRKRSTPQTFTVAQVDAALDLMSINGLSDLESADFSAIGRKMSWAHLAEVFYDVWLETCYR